MFENHAREFPGGLVVRTWYFDYYGLGSIPGLRTEIPHRAACRSQKKKKKKERKKGKRNHCNKILVRRLSIQTIEENLVDIFKLEGKLFFFVFLARAFWMQ